jgi:hypothetical protein
LPEGLIAVAQESPDRFRLATTLPPGRDAARAFGELNTRLASHGGAIFEAAGTYPLQRDDDHSPFHDDRDVAANLVKRAAMGDPTARRTFGFLQRFAWAEFQDLMRDLRQHAASRPEVDRNPARCGSAGAADDALHQLWSWVDWVDRMNAERTPGARTASFLVRPSEVGAGYDLVHDSAPKPCIHTTGPLNAERLAAIADLARRATAWPIGLHPVSVRHDDRARTLEVVFTALATFK